MNKIKKLKLRYYGMIALALALGVTGAYKGIKAYQSDNAPKVVNEGGVVNFYEASEQSSQSEEENLGAVASPDFPNPNCQNELCTYVASGSFADATTTILSVLNPFLIASSTATGTNSGVVVKRDGTVDSGGYVDWLGNTSTVDLVRLNISGPATTSYRIACGASASPSERIVDFLVPTSTKFATHSEEFVLENFVSSTVGVDTKMVAKIYLTPARPYFNCVVDASEDSVGNDNESITQSGNTFDGSYKVRFSR